MAQRTKTDWILFFCVLFLMSVGLLMVYSTTSVGAGWSFVFKQFVAALIAFGIMMWLMKRDYRTLNAPKWAYLPMGIAVPFLAAVYFWGEKRRFFRLGFTGLQPSEFVKPCLVLFLAFAIARRQENVNDRRMLGQAALIVLPAAGLVVFADLGTAVVLFTAALMVLFAAGMKWRYVAAIVLAGTLAAGVAVVAKPYRLGRVLAFVDPGYKRIEQFELGRKVKAYVLQSAYARDPDYHLRQSKLAVGSGGLIGLGPMQGKQKLSYLPEAHTDFIYAVVGEEYGLAGSGLLVLVFLVILWRGIAISRAAPDDFGRYLALGATCMLVVQAFMNMSVVLGLGPTKGIPLPMISYGGSSLVSSLILLGLLLSVSEQTG